jgi:serine/threonine protein kinase
MLSMIGETVSHFRIIERLGSGAMGDVYLADDLNLPRKVALKFLSGGMTSDKRAVERFIREAHAASALDHPNVCTVYETGETPDGQMFIAMAYYEGGNLKSLTDEGPVPVEDAVAFAIGVADGLDKAHQRQIFHRDIKPANLMMTKDGIVKIVDFGIAKLSGVTKVTKTGVTLGTLAYMSPEQTRASDLDGRTDIFSLGVTLYEMLTGEMPFWADNEAALLYRIGNEDPKSVREIRADVPEALERVVNKALEKNPDERYGTTAEMRDELLSILREVAPNRAVRIETLLRAGARRVKKIPRSAVWGTLVAAAVVVAALNWATIRCAVGLCGLGDTKGVAVLPIQTGTTEPGAETFATGLALDLANRVKGLSQFDEGLWVVPPDRV